jgi:hypothetical protein
VLLLETLDEESSLVFGRRELNGRALFPRLVVGDKHHSLLVIVVGHPATG